MRKFEKLLIQHSIPYEANKSMASLCSFKAGGKAQYFIEPTSLEQLKLILNLIKQQKIKSYIFGNGTNTLVNDEGFKGAVISLKNMQKTLYKFENTIIASSNINLFELNTFAKYNNLKGLEFSFGIPGSVGGAVKMNAGAFGHDFSDLIKTVTLLQDAELITLKRNEIAFSYRKCDLEGVIIECELQLDEGDFAEISITQNEYYDIRTANQPLNFPSAGSIFKRNGAVIPSKLIDELGLKGLQVGDAQISTKHAGFIVNLGSAKASDITALIQQIKSIVFEKLRLKLEQELIII